MPPHPWFTRSSRLVYQNPWTRVREDIAEMPDGRTTVYGVVECSDAVGVLPFVDDDHVEFGGEAWEDGKPSKDHCGTMKLVRKK